MPFDTTGLPTDAQPTLADISQWWPEGIRRPCYAPASLVLVRPSGQTVGFTCPVHAPVWASRINGPYLVIEGAEWEARGAGYRGAELGG